MSKIKSDLLNHKKTISVFGLGNVGGPITATWLKNGAKVIGVDKSLNLLNEIKSGNSHKHEPFVSQILTKSIREKRLTLTNDGIYASKHSDIKIIVVPVAISAGKSNLNNVINVANDIAHGLKKNDIIILSPSVPPGTTEKILLPILEKYSKLKGEKDFFIIYNPERIYEGRAIKDIEENYPAILGGLGKKSLELGTELLKIISKKGTIQMSNLATAEAEKLFEGVYRDVNIALANQLADYCSKIGIDFWEARIASNSQPFCHIHYPGTGVGGLCIPIYPQMIIESSKSVKTNTDLISKSRKVNNEMPIKCVKDSLKFYKSMSKKRLKKVTILGLGFRGDVTDTRLSPTYSVVKEFLKHNLKVSVHDPYVTFDPNLPKGVLLTTNLNKALEKTNLIFISTDHKVYSKLSNSILKNSNQHVIIFDGRNILDISKFKKSIIKTIGK